MTNTEQGIFIHVHLSIDQVHSGYNFADIEGIEAISNLRSYLQGTGSGLLRAGLVSGTYANSFVKSTSVHLINFEIIDSKDVPLKDLVTFTGSYDMIDQPSSDFVVIQ
eukprot:CAMPEP_0174823990 /NCGR_PEP_ID=MMETSP1107-20130205/29519_1 /TAXON_ID=36770 /ORGANISM="Paraphysomonas vestita, Strain GFlagA" /LENGTH=107 /DNA_ID=CAMNT_0016048943 /DNA_START=2138 /DNA_END=2458 /DNA_ORIENTATION=+